ncbi:DUF3397 family protein [Planomicrobium okeanokoites]|uniref:DUF3397 family protein n=1 Tax=Planomicrobium okeanokoites TaxID=244 RepID=A0ABV7KNV1_PLAOK|nr:DUF3397 family protein [Planomicrobium okeanokoites]TAA71652.1 DUF3397 family protein [Planomicrobium okeanokoites]
MNLIHNIGAIFIFAPFLAFILLILLTRKKLKRRAIGLSADVTTFLLFISVPVSMKALWDVNISFAVSVTAIIIAIILLIIEWKKSKEIEVLKYARKTWRLYFLLLSMSYILIWLTGLALTLISFI